jgi:hypothetical protein
MKIDQNTFNILKNFSKINPGIVIEEGNRIKTVSPSKTIIGISDVTVVFPRQFAIYNLSRFLTALELFDEPDIIFEDIYMIIKNENTFVRYMYTDVSLLPNYPYPEYTLPSNDVSFKITKNHLSVINNALNVLKLKEILITGDGSNIFLQAANVDRSSQDIYSITIGETDQTFKAVFKSENLNVLPEDYDVVLSKKGASHFKSNSVQYYIVLESTSEF